MRVPSFHYRWTWRFAVAPEALWPFVSDTNRLNRAIGLPAVEQRRTDQDAPPGRQRMRAVRLGVPLEWDEAPFEWVRPFRYGVLRRYRRGPVVEVRMLAELHPEAAKYNHKYLVRCILVAGGTMHPIELPALAANELAALDELYHTTRDVRLRTRAQIMLLAAEQRLVAPQSAAIVRTAEETVRRWLKRYQAEGIDGLADVPRPGGPAKITPPYHERLLQLVRQRPRSLDLPFSLWTNQRLADVLAEATGIRVSDETVRRVLAQAEMVLSRPQHTITSPDPDSLLKKRRSKQPGTA